MKLDESSISRIKQVINFENMSIVLVNNDNIAALSEKEVTRNVYCIDSECEIVWQISPNFDAARSDDCFTYLVTSNSTLTASRFFGDQFEVNPLTGTARHIRWDK